MIIQGILTKLLFIFYSNMKSKQWKPQKEYSNGVMKKS